MSTKSDLLQMKGIISDLPEEQQLEIKKLKNHIKDVVNDNGENGFLALAIVSMEIAVEQEYE